MAAITLDGLALSEAEEAVAELWFCLEEFRLSSPTMAVDIHPDGQVTMEFSFDEPLWAELVGIRLSNWLSSSRPGGWKRGFTPGPAGQAWHLFGPGKPETTQIRIGERCPRSSGNLGALCAALDKHK